MLPCQSSNNGIEGQTNHTAKTVWVAEMNLPVLVHELVHCLQRQRNLAWFALQDCDGYYGTSIRGGVGNSYNEWQAHSVESFLTNLIRLNRLQSEMADKPFYYRCEELAYLPYKLVSVEEWASLFIEKAFNASDEELVEWLTQYGFTTSREVY